MFQEAIAAMATPTSPLNEDAVMNGFHVFLKNALAQAKLERLLDEETLSSAEADLMISGPALCLFFACLRSNTTPPSVPLPRAGLPLGSPPMILNATTCPPAFQGFLSLWSQSVAPVQALPGDQQHDLARIICNREPLSQSSSRNASLKRLAADLRAVAIEISQRRTFQERYQADLQAALDHEIPGTPVGRRSPSPYRATFVPPPVYGEKPSVTSPTTASSAQSSPRNPNALLSPTSPTSNFFASNPDPHHAANLPNVLSSPTSPRNRSRHSSPARQTSSLPQYTPGHTRNASSQSSRLLEPPVNPLLAAGSSSPSSSSQPLPRPASPTIITASDPAIITIRETLYATIADVMARTPSIKPLLRSDPPRAYFAAVGLAILEFSLHSLNRDGSVTAVLGANLELKDVPEDYKPLMSELAAIARRATSLAEEDDDKAIQIFASGGSELPVPRMDRVRTMLEKGVTRGWEETEAAAAIATDETEAVGRAGEMSQRRRERGRSRSPSGTALQLTNRINALALAMTRLPAFTERQNDVFKILAGVTS